ncbi:MAG: glycosyltransferase family 4 protein [Deltaproteobacteria bacterium]|jgi:glycosyltransferase involved in cell wall biosynthesis|nr:glycosyltransferase family 4 protein [Deltaproteobacteria bacterium]
MKILICSPISLQLLADYVENGDSLPEGYRYPLAAYLIRIYLSLGHDVHVVTSTPQMEKTKVWSGDRLTLWVTPRRGKYLFCLDGYRLEIRAMVESIKKANPDIVHAQWTYEFAHAAIASGCPHLITARDSPWAIIRHMTSPYRIFRLIYAYRVVPFIGNLSVISPYLEDHYRRHFFYRRRIWLIPNGLSLELFQKSSKQFNSKKAPVFVSISGWGPSKNLKVILKAFPQVLKQIPEARLIVIGAGLGPGDIGERWALKKGLYKNVDFRGYLIHTECLEVLRNEADIFVHASLEESFCMTLVEAMASGLPVIGGRDSGAVPWVLDNGEAGGLADVSNPDDVAKKMIMLALNQTLYNEVAAQGFNRARKYFIMDKVADEYLKAYKEILGNEKLA